MTVEIYRNVPMKEYRAWKEKSQSKIGKAVSSIGHYLKPFGDPTPNMALGTAFHTDVLTPNMMDYAVAPVINKRTNAGKLEWAAFCDDNSDKAIITAEQAETKRHMVNSVKAEPRAKEIIAACKNFESSARGTIDGVNFGVKGRIDAELGDCAVDLKSTSDASPDGFSKSILNFGYDIQAYMYCTLFDKSNFIFVVTESVEPYTTEVYVLGEETIEFGRQRFEKACERIEEYEKTKIISGYTQSTEPVEINVPNWAFNKEI